MSKHAYLKQSFLKCLTKYNSDMLQTAKDEQLLFNAFIRIISRFFYINRDLHYISDDKMFLLARSDFDFFAEDLAGEEYYYYIETDKNGKEKKHKRFDTNKILSFLRTRQVFMVDYEIDPFREEPIFKIEDGIGGNRLKCIYNKLKISDVKDEIDEKIFDEIIKDYKKHFPDLDDVLDFIVASRFTENRKSTFLHLLVKSNWGKSFFSSILQEIGVGYEIRYGDISENKPVGVNPLEVMSTFCLILDEFKYFSKEMKKITTEMTIEPKFGFKSKVPVYAKILLSAEESESFADGVDEQIINRVIKIKYMDENTVKLDDRAVFKKYGVALYKIAVKKYVSDYLKREIDRYVSLGRFEADRVAEKRLREIQGGRKLKTTNLRAEIMRVFLEFFENYKMMIANQNIPPKMADLSRRITIKGDDVYVQSPDRTLIDILKNEVDDSFFAKAKHKKAEIKHILNPSGGKNYRINGVVRYSLKVDLKDLRKRYLLESKKITIFDQTFEFENIEDLEQKINMLIRDFKEEYSDGQIVDEVKRAVGDICRVTEIYDDETLIKIELWSDQNVPF